MKITTIKIIALAMIMQLIGSYSIASPFDLHSRVTNPNARLGDGPNKHNARHKAGESLKGYFYRVYGDATTVAAKDVKFEGPFKREKMKEFLINCQEQNGDVFAAKPSAEHQEKVGIYHSLFSDANENKMIAKIHHITMKSKVYCILDGVHTFSTQWSAVYLDRDDVSKNNGSIYVDYDKCDSDDRAHLSVGAYSVHYDNNPNCHADLSSISGD